MDLRHVSAGHGPEGHFQYASAPAAVEPYALSPGEFQELTDYGLRYHVQVIPYLDGPAHIAFILKHPEYAGLREYPESNYELCVTNPDSYKLLFGMSSAPRTYTYAPNP